jgi:membrane protein DedA with SNARE-associated domain
MTEGLIDHWGYAAIFAIVVLGNLGLPVPEEGVLLFAGYLVWTGRLQFITVVIVGLVSAALGDNIGYWFGRRYGKTAIRRYGHKLLITSKRLEKAKKFEARYGSFGVFIARFVPGLRFMAGPLAGSMALGYLRFVVANLLGGLIYVPLSVAIGYLIAEGLGDTLHTIERTVGRLEHFAIVLLFLTAIAIFIWRALSSRKKRRSYSES